MSKKLILLIFALVGVGLFINTVTHSPHKGDPKDRQMVNRTAPAIHPATVKEPGNAATSEDWLIQPGQRIGPITGKTTLADLKKLFGPENVQVRILPGPEGTQWEGAIVFPDHPEKTLKLIWKENSQPKTVSMAIIDSPKSIWHTAENVSIGTTLQTLEALNGGPFTLSGFDWDYSGTVLSWGDHGKLRPRFQQNGMLIVRFAPPAGADVDTLMSASGDQPFSSANPVMQKLNPTVYQIQMMFQ